MSEERMTVEIAGGVVTALVVRCDGPTCDRAGTPDTLPGWILTTPFGIQVTSLGDPVWRGVPIRHFCCVPHLLEYFGAVKE